MTPISIRMAEPHFTRLMEHLFPGDGDEHGAVLAAGVSHTDRGTILLVRDVFPARDGIEYVPGKSGYRALSADFVARMSHQCSRERLAYLAVHNHSGRDNVAFSNVDIKSHKRGYPALLDILDGQPVGALVFAQNAVAGEIWLKSGVHGLSHMTIVAPNHRRLYSSPQAAPALDPKYHRQSLLFGAVGQDILRRMKVGIIGLGGAGSLINEWLAHLGVGEIVGVDFERLDVTNQPRVVGSRPLDACAFLANSRYSFLRRLAQRFARYKVEVARRVARRANPAIRYSAIAGDVTDSHTARLLRDCDFLFLCADSAQSRLVFNALTHQYLIPGMQVGSKVSAHRPTGSITDVFTASRPLHPYDGGGCLLCNQLVSPDQLQREALDPDERRRQAYVDDPDVAAPSVITLNAVACAQAANDFLFGVLGLLEDNHRQGYLLHFPRERVWRAAACAADSECRHCGTQKRSIYARGDSADLPCKTR